MEIREIEEIDVAAAERELIGADGSKFKVVVDSRGVTIGYDGGWSVLCIRKRDGKWMLYRYTSLRQEDFDVNANGQISLTKGG